MIETSDDHERDVLILVLEWLRIISDKPSLKVTSRDRERYAQVKQSRLRDEFGISISKSEIPVGQ